MKASFLKVLGIIYGILPYALNPAFFFFKSPLYMPCSSCNFIKQKELIHVLGGIKFKGSAASVV